MNSYSRRQFLRLAGLSSTLLLGGACRQLPLKSQAKAQVVVVGGGFAGATVAKYIRLLDTNIRVILVEPKPQYMTCPGSNWLFADIVNTGQLLVDYQSLITHFGIEIVSEYALSIDAKQKKLVLANDKSLNYDRLVLSPGIDFRWNTLPSYNQAVANTIIPHAWQAGVQTSLLHQQFRAMEDGGVVIITVPAEPYRCPPGPYERASMMAYWLKRYKPKSKVIILDAKTSFSKQKLFEAGWAKHFGYGSANSILEWVSLTDNPLVNLEIKTKTLYTDFGDQYRADVLNIIPPQLAGTICQHSDLTDNSGWCPVEHSTSRSLQQEYIHIIGDAANFTPLPKSAFAANSEAKTCAIAVVSLLNDQPPPTAHWLNTCYSLITPEHGISVAGVYQEQADNEITLVKGAGGISPVNDDNTPALEASYAQSVYKNLVRDSFFG